MTLELTFCQPFAESKRKCSVLIATLGNESLGCCDEKTGNQQGREDDSGTALSRLRGEQQHGLATKSKDHTARTGDKERLPQTFVAETCVQHITTGKRNSSPWTASQQRTEVEDLARGWVIPDAAVGNALRGRIKE